MVAKGPYKPDSQIFIDFDLSGWAFRGFDFNLFFAQFESFPTDDELDTFLTAYRNEVGRLCESCDGETFDDCDGKSLCPRADAFVQYFNSKFLSSKYERNVARNYGDTATSNSANSGTGFGTL